MTVPNCGGDHIVPQAYPDEDPGSPRRYVCFNCTIDAEDVFDDQGNPQVPGGEAVLRELARMLESRGIRCSTVAQHSFYGWDFDAQAGGAEVMCLIQHGGEETRWLLIMERRQSWFKSWFGTGDWPEADDFLGLVHDGRAADPRFADLRWDTPESYDRRGSHHGRPT